MILCKSEFVKVNSHVIFIEEAKKKDFLLSSLVNELVRVTNHN